MSFKQSSQFLLQVLWRWVALPIIWTAIYCIVLYLALPSWKVSDINADGLRAFQNRPLEHNSMSYFVTRVFHTEYFYSSSSRYGKKGDAKHIFNRRFFAFDIAFDDGAIVLRSPGSDERFECVPDGELGEIKYPMVIAADDDGISLPWFNYADAALLFADTRGFVSETSLARAPMRSQCSRRDRQVDGQELSIGDEWDYALSLVIPQDTTASHPLLTVGVLEGSKGHTVQWVEFGREKRTLSVESTSSSSDIKPVSAPSKTYQLRKMILGIIAPSAIGLNNIDFSSWLQLPIQLVKHWLQLLFYGIVGFLLASLIVSFKQQSRRERNSLIFLVEEGASNEETASATKGRNNRSDNVLINIEDSEEDE